MQNCSKLFKSNVSNLNKDKIDRERIYILLADDVTLADDVISADDFMLTMYNTFLVSTPDNPDEDT